MNITIDRSHGFALPAKFYALVEKELAKVTLPAANNSAAITLNFSDADYSAATDGYHPVEIRLEKQPSDHDKNQWQLIYLTDFSYQGGAYPELVKEIDVCFVTKQVYCLYGGWLSPRHAREMIALFVGNFISYHAMTIYDVNVSVE
ncbi:MAG: DUF2787 domain-containing protein [Alteromonadaceae bacterium]|nr:DUF2787 domain-containing protein [Alteromonadaceae bacterium]